MRLIKRNARCNQQAGTKIALLALVAVGMGLGVGGVWIYRSLRNTSPPEMVVANSGVLSDATMAMLKGLDAPLTIRYYALLDSATIPAPLNDYAARVRSLLNDYQSEGNGRVKVTRIDATSDAANAAAVADGMKPFNLDRGETCYLGIRLSYKGNTEVMPLLAPEWERALESDITRTIGRLTAVKPAVSRTPAEAPAPSPAAMAAVKSIIPDFGSLSEEECKRILQEKALASFTAATQEMETKVKDAEKRLVEAQKGGSDEAIQAARANLQKAQLQQAEKIQQVAAQLQDQIAALKLIKAK